MNFTIGDSVRFIDEAGAGEITKVKDGLITVLTETGFEQEYYPHELILNKSFTVGGAAPKDVRKPPKANKTSTKVECIEQDLHIGALVDFTGGMSNYDMLRKQLFTAKTTIEKAKRAGIKKIVFIHGVGEGILRQELYKLLDAHERLTYYDADYAKYGKGATEVVLQ